MSDLINAILEDDIWDYLDSNDEFDELEYNVSVPINRTTFPVKPKHTIGCLNVYSDNDRIVQPELLQILIDAAVCVKIISYSGFDVTQFASHDSVYIIPNKYDPLEHINRIPNNFPCRIKCYYNEHYERLAALALRCPNSRFTIWTNVVQDFTILETHNHISIRISTDNYVNAARLGQCIHYNADVSLKFEENNIPVDADMLRGFGPALKFIRIGLYRDNINALISYLHNIDHEITVVIDDCNEHDAEINERFFQCLSEHFNIYFKTLCNELRTVVRAANHSNERFLMESRFKKMKSAATAN